MTNSTFLKGDLKSFSQIMKAEKKEKKYYFEKSRDRLVNKKLVETSKLSRSMLWDLTEMI